VQDVDETVRDPGPLSRWVRDQRVAFVLVGGFNTVLGTAWFIAFQLFFERIEIGRFDYILSLVCAHAASVLCSFVMQRYLVFRVRGRVLLDLVRFVSVSLTSLGLNLVLLPLVVEVLGVPKIPAQLLVTAVLALGTYFLHRDFSFRRTVPAASAGDAAGMAPTAGPVARQTRQDGAS